MSFKVVATGTLSFAISFGALQAETLNVYPAEVSTNSYGKCYRATRDIEPGIVVERFVGKEIPYEEVPESEIIYAATDGKGTWTIPLTNARYINHSCDPNCKIN